MHHENVQIVINSISKNLEKGIKVSAIEHNIYAILVRVIYSWMNKTNLFISSPYDYKKVQNSSNYLRN